MDMTLTITLPLETEQKLRERAARAGQTLEGFVRELVEREVHCPDGSQGSQSTKTFDEIFAPLREEVAQTGICDEELDRLLEQAREEAWQEKKARQGKGP